MMQYHEALEPWKAKGAHIGTNRETLQGKHMCAVFLKEIKDMGAVCAPCENSSVCVAFMVLNLIAHVLLIKPCFAQGPL